VSFSFAVIIAVVIALETVEQLCYRMAGRTRGRYFHYAVPAVILHLLGLGIWFLALKLMPLSYAMPFMGAAYVTIAIASRALFGERISRRGWLGIALVTIGVVLVGEAGI